MRFHRPWVCLAVAFSVGLFLWLYAVGEADQSTYPMFALFPWIIFSVFLGAPFDMGWLVIIALVQMPAYSLVLSAYAARRRAGAGLICILVVHSALVVLAIWRPYL